jgi:hypothetical protein
MTGGGYVKIWRRLLGSPIMKHDGLCRLWVYCLLQAAWKDTKTLLPGTTAPFELRRGQFLTSRTSLHQDLYKDADLREGPIPSSSTVWRWLMSLVQMECINIETVGNRCSKVTVCNYTSYQDCSETGAPQVPRTCPAGEPQVPRRCPAAPKSFLIENEEIEEGKEGKNDTQLSVEVAPSKSPKRFVKPSLDDVTAYVSERGNRIDPEAFCAYYEANGWRVGKNPMKDWKAAVRHWESNERSRQPKKTTARDEYLRELMQ